MASPLSCFHSLHLLLLLRLLLLPPSPSSISFGKEADFVFFGGRLFSLFGTGTFHSCNRCCTLTAHSPMALSLSLSLSLTHTCSHGGSLSLAHTLTPICWNFILWRAPVAAAAAEATTPQTTTTTFISFYPPPPLPLLSLSPSKMYPYIIEEGPLTLLFPLILLGREQQAAPPIHNTTSTTTTSFITTIIVISKPSFSRRENK